MQPASKTAVAIFDRDGPCFPCKMGPAFQDTMALEMGPAFCARWAALRSQRASRFYAAVLPRAWRIPMPWLLGESSTDWRACDDMALAQRIPWRHGSHQERRGVETGGREGGRERVRTQRPSSHRGCPLFKPPQTALIELKRLLASQHRRRHATAKRKDLIEACGMIHLRP